MQVTNEEDESVFQDVEEPSTDSTYETPPSTFEVDIEPPTLNNYEMKAIHLSSGLRELKTLFEKSSKRSNERFKPLHEEVFTL